MSKRARASRAPGNTARSRLLDRRSSVIPPEPTNEASEPANAASEPIHAPSEPIHTASEPANTSSETIQAASEPVHAASEPATEASEPAHASSEPVHTASEPANTSSEPIHTASEPAHAASEPAHAASEPAHAASEPATKAKSAKPAKGAKKAKPEPELDDELGFPHSPEDDVDGSLSPVNYDDDDDGHAPPSAGLLERRARLRRIVMGVVGVAGLLVVGAIAKGALSKPDVVSAPAPTVNARVEFPAKAAAVAPVEAAPTASADAAPPAADTAAAADTAPPAADTAAPEEAASAAPAESAAPAAEALDAEAFAALKRETENLFNRGQSKEAIASARRMIAADPSEAMGYLFLGSGLQNMGKWQDGIAVYSQCVREATRGPVGDCKRFGGTK